MTLDDLGWDDAFGAAFEPWARQEDVQPGRIAVEFNHLYRVFVAGGEQEAAVSGYLKHRARSQAELPVVGDWVAVRTRPGEALASIRGVLARRSRFSRKVAGQVTSEQVVAANVDVVFLVMALHGDFSVRRLERYLLLARESRAAPVILLTKPDLCDDVAAAVAEVTAVAGGAPVLVVNAKRGEGLEPMGSLLPAGRTGALLGSSGVGKSTIINALAGVVRQKTREVRDSDQRGRHTTTNRELIALPGGGLLIDTPGMRELQLWDVAGAAGGTFEEIETLAAACRFTDCRHRGEPRCAVEDAVERGDIARARLDSYLKLQDELAHLARQQDQRLQIEDKRRWRVVHKAQRARNRQKGR
ncbi:MAG: ribosome small subunit-dependent GTPase A [Acidimicrobiia bacterium]|nr:ribosome small subunit-dependent GTPase A [Acidimicrobiia bacterium]